MRGFICIVIFVLLAHFDIELNFVKTLGLIFVYIVALLQDVREIARD